MDNRFNEYDFVNNRNLHARGNKRSNGTPSRDITNDIRNTPVAGDSVRLFSMNGIPTNLRPSTSLIIRLGASSKLSPEDVLFDTAINLKHKETCYEQI